MNEQPMDFTTPEALDAIRDATKKRPDIVEYMRADADEHPELVAWWKSHGLSEDEAMMATYATSVYTAHWLAGNAPSAAQDAT